VKLKSFRSLVIGVTFLLTSFSSSAQVLENADHAFNLSIEKHKHVLLIFEGSDWCAPCIQFERKVLSQSTFLSFADNNLIILRADFPQRKKIAREVQLQNDELAEQYNPKGIFPYILLIRPDKTVSATLRYTKQLPDEFISEITRALAK
jgi:thiamine biosynthesis lipoprotein